jgi:hypothetical protein
MYDRQPHSRSLFPGAADGKSVICDANPVLGKSGFVMKLTKALPLVTEPRASSPSPWLLQLEDGSVCAPFTGTRPAVNHEPAVWSCIKPGVPPSPRTNSLVTKVHPGKVWTAERYAEAAVATGNSKTESRKVEVQIIPVARSGNEGPDHLRRVLN